MKLDDLKDKMVAILGYGLEGQAVANYLYKHGIAYTVFDQSPIDKLALEIQIALKESEKPFVCGPDAFKELAGFQVAFRSPGIPISEDFKILESRGLVLTSQTKYFFENCTAEIIGVTGTKGKGTTSTLIYKILKASGHNAFLTGNIGEVQPLDFIDELAPEDKIVFELSSFQLQDLNQSPHIAVVLMVTSEHLDYHKDVEEYRLAKANIAKYQKASDFIVINSDYEGSKEIGNLSSAQKVFFNRSLPEYISTSEIGLRGAHNLENISAAAAVAKLFRVNDNVVREVVKEFKGLPHRLELVVKKGEVEFYNDSYSTIPETTIAAIKAFGEPIVLILGGSKKNSDFTDLAKVIVDSPNLRGIVLIGQTAPEIKKAILSAGGSEALFIEGAKGMKEIVDQAQKTAKPGDVVVLSPACASFDMFANYKDRGEQFKQAVIAL